MIKKLSLIALCLANFSHASDAKKQTEDNDKYATIKIVEYEKFNLFQASAQFHQHPSKIYTWVSFSHTKGCLYVHGRCVKGGKFDAQETEIIEFFKRINPQWQEGSYFSLKCCRRLKPIKTGIFEVANDKEQTITQVPDVHEKEG